MEGDVVLTASASVGNTNAGQNEAPSRDKVPNQLQINIVVYNKFYVIEKLMQEKMKAYSFSLQKCIKNG